MLGKYLHCAGVEQEKEEKHEDASHLYAFSHHIQLRSFCVRSKKSCHYLDVVGKSKPKKSCLTKKTCSRAKGEKREKCEFAYVFTVHYR